jgi:hypothetical protein
MRTKENILHIDNFRNIKLFYKNKNIEFKTYEELISKILIQLSSDNNKTNLLIGIENNISVILFLIINSIISYFENMKNPNTKILDFLVDGDKVVYKNKIGIFKGIHKMNNIDYIELEYAKGSKNFVPIENQHLLTQYTGSKKLIGKLEGLSQEENITKKFVAEFMKVNSNELAGVVTESTLVVASSKEGLFELIDSIGIRFKEKQYTLPELFPFIYCTSEENYEYFKGKKNNEKALIKFCSNINTALDIIKDDKGIRKVVLLGEKAYKEVLETNLRMMEFIKSIEKIIIFDTWNSTFDFSNLLNRDDPYSLYAQTKEVIIKDINLYENEMKTKVADIQEECRNLISMFIYRSNDVFNIDKSKEIYKIANKIHLNLHSLCIDSNNNLNSLEFVKLAYYSCNALEQSILPLNWCSNNKENILEKIQRLKEICKIYDKTRFEFKVMQEVIENLEAFAIKIMGSNDKFSKLKDVVKGNNKTLVVLKSDVEKKELERYSALYRLKNIKFTKLKRGINYKEFDCIIFTFSYDNRYFNVFNNPEIGQAVFTLQGRENYKFKRILNENNRMMKYIEKNNKLFNKLEESDPLEIDNFTDYYVGENDNSNLEEKIESVLSENWLQILLHNTQTGNLNNSNSNILVKSIVKFEDNKYALISDNCQLNTIDRKNNDIKQKSRNDIEIGEELVFVNTKVPGKGDIIKETIEKLLKNSKFDLNHGTIFKLNYMWKNLLSDYMESNNLTTRQISMLFKNVYNKDVEPLTISNWLDGTVIGPRDSNNIRIISEIVSNERLSGQLDEVIDACKHVRSIQIQIRKAIAKMIISSVVVGKRNTDDEIYELVKSVIGEFSDYAYIGIIATIEEVNMNVSGAYINRVLDKESE